MQATLGNASIATSRYLDTERMLAALSGSFGAAAFVGRPLWCDVVRRDTPRA
jgi:hypothetical protein